MKDKKLLAGICCLTGLGCALALFASSQSKQKIGEQSTEMTAGVAAAIGAAQTDYSLTAGVSDTFSGICLASIEEAKEEVTASAYQEEEEEGFCGYTNLGMSNCQGNLNIRKGPSIEEEIVGKMTDHCACEILGEEDGWYQITSGKVSGYVCADYISTGEEALALAQDQVETVATVTTTTLRVRAEANTDSDISSLVGNGEELYVLEELDGWVKVEVDDEEGYCSSDYVTLSQKLPTAQTLTELKYGMGISDVRVNLVSFALDYVGNPYVWGGTSLTSGVDCSGFVMKVYAQYGIYLPHSSKAQAGYGTKISASEAQPGDLFFYGKGKTINHVAIYIGNGQIVHASNPRDGIKISSAYYRTPICVVRLLSEN